MLVDLRYHPKRGVTQAFRVEVHAHAIDHLIADASEGYRVYELMAIRRPGDVWKYLWVEPLEVPDEVKAYCRSKRTWGDPENMIPLVIFDKQFFWQMEDTHPEDECWLNAREGIQFRDEMWRLFSLVQRAQSEMQASSDPLITIQIELMSTGRHVLDKHSDTPLNRTPPGYVSPTVPLRTNAYYAKLREMLARPDVRSVVTRGNGYDYQTHRMMCTEQRLRAKALGKHQFHAYPLDIGHHHFDPSDGWEACYIVHYEGMGYGDLWIELEDDEEDFVKWLVEEHKCHHKWILLFSGGNNVSGYRRMEGDGWVLLEDETEERYFRNWGEDTLKRAISRM